MLTVALYCRCRFCFICTCSGVLSLFSVILPFCCLIVLFLIFVFVVIAFCSFACILLLFYWCLIVKFCHYFFLLFFFLLCHWDAALAFSCFVVIYCCCIVVVVDAAFWCFFQCYFFESPTYCCCQVIFNVFRAFVLITVLLLSPSFTLFFRFTPLIAAYMRLFPDGEWKKQFANPYCWDISCISPQFHNTCTTTPQMTTHSIALVVIILFFETLLCP